MGEKRRRSAVCRDLLALNVALALIGGLMTTAAVGAVRLRAPSGHRSHRGTPGRFTPALGPNGSYTMTAQSLGVNTTTGDSAFNDATIPSLLQQAGIGRVRLGGSGADTFNWAAGTGNPTWPQFMNVLANAKAAPVLTVNYGDLTVGSVPGPQAAANWVANALTFPNYSDKTALWIVSNEEYGEWENDQHPHPHTPQSFATYALPYMQDMHAADPNVKVGVPVTLPREVAGGTGTWVPDPDAWNNTILGQDSSQINFVDLHWYPIFGIPVLSNQQLFATVKKIPSTMSYLQGVIKRDDPGVPVSVSESNISQSEIVYNAQPVAALYAAATALTFLSHGAADYMWWQVHNSDNQDGDFGFLSNGSGSPGPSATTLSAGAAKYANNVSVASANGFYYGHQLTLGTGSGTESRLITAVPGSTTLSAPSGAGSATLYVTTTGPAVVNSTDGSTTNWEELFARGTPVTIGSGADQETATVKSVGTGASSDTLAAPSSAGSSTIYMTGVPMGGQNLPVFMPTGFAPGAKVTIGSGSDQETATVKHVGESSSLGTTLVLPASPGDTTVHVTSVTNTGTGLANYVGEPLVIDTGANQEVDKIASVGTGASSTTLSLPTAVGATKVYVGSVSGDGAGDHLIIDTGANQETATIASVGTASAKTTTVAPAAAGNTTLYLASTSGISAGDRLTIDTGADQETGTVASVGTAAARATTLSAASGAGATDVKVASVRGLVVGDNLLIDTGANQESDQIVSVGTAGASGTGVTLATPLQFAHAAGATTEDEGTGITLSAPLEFAHTAGAAAVDPGTGITLSAPLEFAHTAGAAALDPGTGITLARPLRYTHAAGAPTVDAGTGITLTRPLRYSHPSGETASTPGTGITLSKPLGSAHSSGETVTTSGITFTPALSGSFPTGTAVNELGLTEPPLDTPMPAYWGYVLSSYLTQPGSKLSEISSPSPNVLAFKSFRPGQSESVMLINTNDTAPALVSLDGMPGSPSSTLQTHSYSLETPALDPGVVSGSTTVRTASSGMALDPESITVLTGTASMLAPEISVGSPPAITIASTHSTPDPGGHRPESVTVTVTGSALISQAPTCTLDGTTPLALTESSTGTWTATVTHPDADRVACTGLDLDGNAYDATARLSSFRPQPPHR
jgi:hypothetical protein